MSIYFFKKGFPTYLVNDFFLSFPQVILQKYMAADINDEEEDGTSNGETTFYNFTFHNPPHHICEN